MCLTKEALLRFKVHLLQLGGKHYLLLPKLNSNQVGVLERRFSEIGKVRRGAILALISKRGVIRVSEAGLCWSSFDPSDAVLPAVPDILTCPKERVPVETVRDKYLRTSKLKQTMTIRVMPRLESSSLWRELRGSGLSALAPDEHAIVSSLLRRTRGKSEMVTDFFVSDSMPLVYGRRRYFESPLDSNEAALTLCVIGEHRQRNSYIPNDGELRPIPMSAFSRRDWIDLLAHLGEWCSFVPF